MILLNKVEQDFAMNHHNRVLHFLRKNELEQEFYPVVIYGYLEAVFEYHRVDRCRGKFAKKADYFMTLHLHTFMHSEQGNNSLDEACKNEIQAYIKDDVIVDLQENYQLTKRLLLEIEKTEHEVLSGVLKGYTTDEICKSVDIAPVSIYWLISRIRSRVTALMTATE